MKHFEDGDYRNYILYFRDWVKKKDEREKENATMDHVLIVGRRKVEGREGRGKRDRER